MIVITDRRNRKRSLRLREQLLEAGIACAACTPEDAGLLRGAPVTVCFAESEDMLSLVSVRAGRTSLIAVNVSGRKMYHPDAVIWDSQLHGDLASFAVRTAEKQTGTDVRRLTAGYVTVTPEAAYFHLNYLALTDTERLILFHLAAGADRFHREEEIRKYAFRECDLRRKNSTVSVHICNINKKAMRACGEKAVTCRRGSGYAILTAPDKAKRRRRTVLTPPFV